MSFEPSQYSDASTTRSRPRKGERRRLPPGPLGEAIQRTRERIEQERRLIRGVKAEIHALHRAHRPTAAKLRELHSLEWSLHRDQHLLVVLLGPAGPRVAAALQAERQARQGVMEPKVQGYPAPSSPPPAEKSENQVVQEAAAEAADPKAADANDADVAALPDDAPEGASVALEVRADTNVPLLKRPLFWFGVGLAGLAWWQRDNLGAILMASQRRV